ncbi:hypothetical protein [Pseudomonas lundensis]|uniref:hypothetical protein n=1 Tax=Pseudomonas lundensis TaxID=86185 RepID=UPI00117A973F|nr:hypothetical protein [Pseudomonas lundensis]
MGLINYIVENTSWIFSGIGIFALSGLIALIKFRNREKGNSQTQNISGGSTGYQSGKNINLNKKNEND